MRASALDFISGDYSSSKEHTQLASDTLPNVVDYRSCSQVRVACTCHTRAPRSKSTSRGRLLDAYTQCTRLSPV